MIAVGLLLATSLVVTPKRDTVPRAAITAEIASMVRIDTLTGPDGRPAHVVGFNTDAARAGSLLAPFLKANGQLVWYLAVHTPGAGTRLVTEGNDPKAARDSVVRALRESQSFNDQLHYMLASYWRPTGRRIEGYAAPPRTVVSSKTLQRVGARFFYPDNVSSKGDTLFTHICAGINGISELPEPVDPMVEAFVFVAVNKAMFGTKNSPLMQAFDVASSRAKAATVSKDSTKRVVRAQGAMWAYMENSPAMASALSSAFHRHGALMPFRVRSSAK
jgi:hypothetical protein